MPSTPTQRETPQSLTLTKVTTTGRKSTNGLVNPTRNTFTRLKYAGKPSNKTTQRLAETSLGLDRMKSEDFTANNSKTKGAVVGPSSVLKNK